MNRFHTLILGFLLLCVTPALVLAQVDDCPAIVEAALEAVESFCDGAGRNQACYGNISLTAEPQPGAEDFQFEQVGDIVDVSQIQTMTLEPLDAEAGIWGVALMRIQANIPETLPGQNVTFVLFGDVQITNDVEADDPDYNPMQAFTLTTGIGDAACDEAPESGLIVQTPDGVGEITFNVNGVDVAMGSTIIFQAMPDEEMRISAIEGSAVVNIDDEIHTAIAGTRLRIPVGPDGRPTGPPPLPEAYGENQFRHVPIGALERRIDIHAPLGDADLQTVHRRMEMGEPPCGAEPFPPCDHFPEGFFTTRRPCLSRPGGQGRECEHPGLPDTGIGGDERPCRPGQDCDRPNIDRPDCPPRQTNCEPPDGSDGQPPPRNPDEGSNQPPPRDPTPRAPGSGGNSNPPPPPPPPTPTPGR